ncbi:hypothetical protein [Paracoccus albus]|nr:hypothetical protein [Paracoccus albus]WBU61105.1 hypothetical protein PAF20_04110 [Paracoccus albus]
MSIIPAFKTYLLDFLIGLFLGGPASKATPLVKYVFYNKYLSIALNSAAS